MEAIIPFNPLLSLRIPATEPEKSIAKTFNPLLSLSINISGIDDNNFAFNPLLSLSFMLTLLL